MFFKTFFYNIHLINIVKMQLREMPHSLLNNKKNRLGKPTNQ